MRKFLLVIVLLIPILSCSKRIPTDYASFLPDPNKPEGIEEAFSYVLGYYLAESYEGNVDYEYMARGMLDYPDSLFSRSEMESIATEYYMNLNESVERDRAEEADRNSREAEVFLQSNGARSTVKVFDSGLQIECIKEGDGESASEAEIVVVDYRLTLPSGQVVDSTWDRGYPAVLALNDLIEGFALAVREMSVGDEIRAWVPPRLGYGINGPGVIPPMSFLIFDIHLLEIIM